MIWISQEKEAQCIELLDHHFFVFLILGPFETTQL